MQSKTSVSPALLELIWWVFTAVLIALVLLPIYSSAYQFPFYLYNAVFVASAVTATRYIFLLRATPLSERQVLKGAVAIAVIPLIFYIVQGINAFQIHIDEEDLNALVGHLPRERQLAILTYLRAEMIFFGVWAVVSLVILPFRLLVSIWRQYNRR